MATIHEILSAKDGETFISVGPATVLRQSDPRLAKNGRPYCRVELKSGPSEVLMMLWDDAALWKLPTDQITLKGKFVKNTFRDSPGINCDDLSPPERAIKLEVPTENGCVAKPTIKECLDTGLRAADYVTAKGRPELASEAFAFACNARMNGVKPK